MAKKLLVRHAKSYANARDLAFGNVESPLNEKGIGQIPGLVEVFKARHDIDPRTYGRPVVSSTYRRPRQTALFAGFRCIEFSTVINEAVIPTGLLSGREIINKHRQERWVPQELQARAKRYIELVRNEELPYEIFFTHGFFIASVLMELSGEYDVRGEEFPHVFSHERGFIPELATIVPVTI